MAASIVLVISGEGDGALIRDGAKEAARLLGYPNEPRKISLIEAAYLIYIGNAEALTEDGQRLTFRDVISIALKRSAYAWVLFEVYYDLRKRGKIPVPGPRPHSLLVRRSKKALRYSHYILVLEESRKLPIEELFSFVEEAMHNQWEPIVAIVDRYGDITYYSMRPLYPRRAR